MRTFVRQLVPSLIVLALATVGLGVVYPLVVWGIGQGVFRHQADGSLVKRNGVVVGSSLIGQPFTDPRYFHPRPSAAGTGYDARASGGSNLGPNNPKLLDGVAQRVADYRKDNGLPDGATVPVDAVTSSGSGLDPHISVANARLQAPRVASARGRPVGAVLQLVDANTEKGTFGFLDDTGVNVLRLNLALDGP